MFEVGSYIIYGKSGVCKVKAVGEPQLSGIDTEKLYYTLEPVYGSETIFIPIDAKVPMRSILGREEAQELLEQIPQLLAQFGAQLPELEQRELPNYYKSLLGTGEILDELRLLACIYAKKNSAERGGKKLCQTDKLYEGKAEELLFGELATALGVSKEEIAAGFNAEF